MSGFAKSERTAKSKLSQNQSAANQTPTAESFAPGCPVTMPYADAPSSFHMLMRACASSVAFQVNEVQPSLPPLTPSLPPSLPTSCYTQTSPIRPRCCYTPPHHHQQTNCNPVMHRLSRVVCQSTTSTPPLLHSPKISLSHSNPPEIAAPCTHPHLICVRP
jgi:hypothetical protein